MQALVPAAGVYTAPSGPAPWPSVTITAVSCMNPRLSLARWLALCLLGRAQPPSSLTKVTTQASDRLLGVRERPRHAKH